MRRIIGVQRKQLVFQFMGESFVFSNISGIFAFALIELADKFTALTKILGVD
jgi:hypothetical protein